MALTHTLSWTYTTGSASVQQSSSISSELERNVDAVIPASSTDYSVAFECDYSQCKAFFLMADADMTVETNSSSAPSQTFTLAANVPVMWMYSAGGANCPVTADITTLFITSTDGGNLYIRSLEDATD